MRGELAPSPTQRPAARLRNGTPAAPDPRSARPGLSAPVQWLALLAISGVLVAILRLAHAPAAGLLGTMAAGIAIAAFGGSIAVPRWMFVLAQGVIGVLIAGRFTRELFDSVVRGWPLVLAVTVGVFAASSFLGWVLARWRVLPGATAVWGSSPGGAIAMIVMAEAHGADSRLVAFMQYLWIVLVTAVASVVAHIVAPAGALAPVWSGSLDGPRFAWTLALIVGGTAVGVWARIPTGASSSRSSRARC